LHCNGKTAGLVGFGVEIDALTIIDWLYIGFIAPLPARRVRQSNLSIFKEMSRDLRIRFIASLQQELELGGLGKATRRRLDGLAEKLRRPDQRELTQSVAPLKPGTTLLREWNGATHTVPVQEGGFEYWGER
jgi:hypothetical protein